MDKPIIDPALAPPWDGDVARARALQLELAGRVRLFDDFPPLRRIAGVDVGFEDDGATTRAAAVLLDAQSLQPLADVVARVPTRMPYIPGLLSFRELPAVLQALAELPQVPDLVFVDGQGVAHPRGLGIAAHLGVITGLPTIGVAKKILVGTHAEVGPRRGDRTDLLHRGQRIGTVLRSKERVKPLIVSPGHRVGQDSAPVLVLACCTRYRLPEPTRLADRIASRRDRHRAHADEPSLFPAD
ncbi:endonuclease V [Frateuria sp. Soil773]|uniref:deoxyribonuclease V n=1 Tax=Frateuria sp. Soil773 TaxID=1736407 RepID=UPI0006FE1C83|nr:deoxyribonuclease V [Frateuria sp. Soil773]KRE89339.1 endonuclease V [Frateuria sp. Soil773]